MRPTDEVRRLRETLLAAGYTSDGVTALLGPVAYAALARHETVPARRATGGGTPLETLVRLFLLQLAVPEPQARAALPLPEALASGVVERSGDEVRALLDVRPYDDTFYVVSDLGTGLDGDVRPLRADHVLGVGGASAALAQLTVRPQVRRALDLGTGCGIQALHLAQHAGHVVATDVLPRALDLARMSAALSEVAVELRPGSLFAPVHGEAFDLVVSNPPFVIGAPEHYAYRDGGLPGDEVCRRLVQQAPAHLTDGGWCQLLANWVHPADEDWAERVARWLPAGCDAWVVQREVLDPAEYVTLWLHDSGTVAGPEFLARYDAWLGGLDAAGVEAVGFGWVVLRRTGAAAPSVRVEDWPHTVEQPLGPHVQAAFDRTAWLRRHRDDDRLLAARLRVAPDVVQETSGEPGAEDPQTIVLRQALGMRRAERVDAVTAGLVGACDGMVPLGVLLDAVAAVLAADPHVLRRRLPDVVRRLVADGVLLPA